MKVRVHTDTDPITLSVVSAGGDEHATLDKSNGRLIDIMLIPEECIDEDGSRPTDS